MNYIVLPPYNFLKGRKTKSGMLVKHEQQIAKGGKVSIKGASIENDQGYFIPDIVLDCETKNLIVEIAVTHKVDRKKMRHIRRRNMPAIEIRLDVSDALLSREELHNKLQNDLLSKFWLFHPAQREAERIFFMKLREIRKVDRRAQVNRAPPVLKSRQPSIMKQTTTVPQQPTFRLLKEYDKMAEEFNREHNRYPTLEECKHLWPHLWGEKT